jgi:hypothetical protein
MCLPSARKAFIVAQILPHLVPLLSPEGAALNEPVYTPVSMAIFVSCIEETAQQEQRGSFSGRN